MSAMSGRTGRISLITFSSGSGSTTDQNGSHNKGSLKVSSYLETCRDVRKGSCSSQCFVLGLSSNEAKISSCLAMNARNSSSVIRENSFTSPVSTCFT
jgi:hypothetical protein